MYLLTTARGEILLGTATRLATRATGSFTARPRVSIAGPR